MSDMTDRHDDDGGGARASESDGDFGSSTAFDAAYVYGLLQQACRALEDTAEFAASAYVAQAMALVQARFQVGVDHRREP